MAYPELPGHPFNLETTERVGVIVLDSRGYLLLVENGGGRLSLPKGCRHWGETEWDGAMRECYEETGVDLEDPLLPITLLCRNLKLRYGTYQEVRLALSGRDVKTRCQTGESVRVFWAAPWTKEIRSNPACNADLKEYLWKQQRRFFP
jgi:ADP-ribose pyrophosphatase YjhB (NUDIX family)